MREYGHSLTSKGSVFGSHCVGHTEECQPWPAEAGDLDTRVPLRQDGSSPTTLQAVAPGHHLPAPLWGGTCKLCVSKVSRG